MSSQSGKSISLLDLFSGIGGFAKGIENAGIRINKHYYSEVDKYAEAIYRKHWAEATSLGAVENIRGYEYDPFDFITFGFPCQDISIAGRRQGLRGSRSNIFFEAVRIIKENQPKSFIFENVKGLFSSNGGKDFITVLRTIADLGVYECQWQLVNTAWFLPQNRERIIFIGCLGERGRPEVFPISEGHGENHESVTSTAIDRNYWKGADNHAQRTMKQINEPQSQGYRVYDTNGLASTLAGEAGGVGAKTGLYDVGMVIANSVTPDAYLARGERKRVNGKAVLTSMHERRIRRLTPTECERLQGFPDGWTEYGIDEDGKEIKISDTQRYKVLGNAVTTNVIQKIMERICAR